MKKNTGKVLSLVLALAMVVTSFSATFVSASTVEVAGTKGRVSVPDDMDVVSDKYQDIVLINDMDDAFGLTTMDREDCDDVEYVSFSKTGDSLVTVKTNRDTDKKEMILKKGASGEATITVVMKGTYTDDDTDKEVTVRGSKSFKITAYTQGEVKLSTDTEVAAGDHPSDIETAAVNDSGVTLALWMANYSGDGIPAWTKIEPYVDSEFEAKDGEDGHFKFGSQKIFSVTDTQAATDKNNIDESWSGSKKAEYKDDDSVIYLPMIKTDKEGKEEPYRYYAKVSTTKIELNAPKIEVTKNTDAQSSVATVDDKKGDKIKETIGVGKKFRVGVAGSVESAWNNVNKIGARTVIGTGPDPDVKWADQEDEVKIVTGYELIVADGGSLRIEGGNVGAISGGGTGSSVSIEKATVNGGIDGPEAVTVTNATVNGKVETATTITLDENAKVETIDEGNAAVTIQGSSVTKDVKASSVEITGDADYKTAIGGDVKAKAADGLSIEAEDGAVVIGGKLIATGTDASMSLTGDLLTIGGIDADYYGTSITFDGFKGTFSMENVAAAQLELTESTVTIDKAAHIYSVDVDEDSAITFMDTLKVSDISGDGMVSANSDKVYVTGGISDVKFKLLDSPANGKVALRADTNAVDPDDFNPIGFTAKVIAQSSTVDKIVVDTVKFAGLSFDKTEATIAKGYTADVTVAPYPAGTALPEGAKIAWNLEGDDAYINYTLNAAGDTATVKVVDFNADYAYSNKATLTATIVDEDGYEIEGYVAASCDIQGVAVPDTSVTLDTKTVTKNVGEIYQFIAKSSDGSAVTAASSDESVAKVALYDANDARGYKFQINAVGAGTATITVKNAVGASATMTVTVVAGQATLKIDTTSYKMAPGNIYDFKVTTTGTTAVPVVTDSRNGSIVTLTDLGGGKYRITGRNVGTAFITATIGDTRCSLKVEVAAGATQGGVTGNNVSIIK